MRHVIFWICGVITLTISLLPISFASPKAEAYKFAWPTHFNNERLVPCSLSANEQKWLSHFPGNMKRYNYASGHVILRQVTTATRKLHPASDCYRAMGYSIVLRPLFKDEAGVLWGQFNASKNTEIFVISERITGPNQAWTDISSWYWHALWSSDKGPWIAYTWVRKSTDK